MLRGVDPETLLRAIERETAPAGDLPWDEPALRGAVAIARRAELMLRIGDPAGARRLALQACERTGVFERRVGEGEPAAGLVLGLPWLIGVGASGGLMQMAAAAVAACVYIVALVASFFLPEPPEQLPE